MRKSWDFVDSSACACAFLHDPLSAEAEATANAIPLPEILRTDSSVSGFSQLQLVFFEAHKEEIDAVAVAAREEFFLSLSLSSRKREPRNLTSHSKQSGSGNVLPLPLRSDYYCYYYCCCYYYSWY